MDLLRGSPVCLDKSLEQKTKTKTKNYKKNKIAAGLGKDKRWVVSARSHTHRTMA